MIHLRSLLLILIISTGSQWAVFSQNAPALSKPELLKLYSKLYQSSELDSMPWKKTAQQCDCGSIDDKIYEKAENRLNFFRIVTGLPPLKINPQFNRDAQNAAFFVKINNELTHYARKEMKCYSKSAAAGCLKSCLGTTDFENFKDNSFITGFIDDYGAENYFTGHRKWILYSKLKEFGYGATDNSEAILTVDGISFSSNFTADYIAYPWNGYVPAHLIFPKWSFSIPENHTVDYSEATILMTDSAGKEIKIAIQKLYKNFLDHTVVWVVTDMFSAEDIEKGNNQLEAKGFLNKKIRVLIRKVKVDGVLKNFEYFVTPFKI